MVGVEIVVGVKLLMGEIEKGRKREERGDREMI